MNLGMNASTANSLQLIIAKYFVSQLFMYNIPIDVEVLAS